MRSVWRVLKGMFVGNKIVIRPHRPLYCVLPERPTEAEAFFESIVDKDMETTETMLRSKPELVNSRNESGLTPLMQAIAVRNHPAIDLLLANGADVNAVDGDGWGAKAWAIFVQDQIALMKMRGLTVLYSQ